MDTPTLKNKWIEVYFGLFGPCLTYHSSGYDDDNTRLVVSLIFCQIYLTLPWKHHSIHENIHDLYATYGFYSASEPDRMIFIWGSKYKMLLMPWAKVIVERSLLDREGGPVWLGDDVDTFDNIQAEVDEVPSHYIHECTNRDITYFIVKQVTRPRIFKNLNMFNKTSYEVHTHFAKAFNGYNSMVFNISQLMAVETQIELQKMMRDKFYTDF